MRRLGSFNLAKINRVKTGIPNGIQNKKAPCMALFYWYVGGERVRYAIKRSSFAGCWCMGSLDVQRTLAVPYKALSAAPVMCVAVFNIKASYAQWIMPTVRLTPA